MAAASPSDPQRTFSILASVILVIAVLHYVQAVFIPLAMAVLLTFVLLPAVEWLQRQGLRRVFAVLVAVLLAFSLLGAAGWLIAVEVQGLVRELPANEKNLRDKMAGLEGMGPGLLDQLQTMWKDITRGLHKDENKPPPLPVEVTNTESFAWVPSILGPAVEFLATALLVVVLVVFMLIRREDLRNRLLRLVGKGRLTLTTRALDEAAQRISRFLMTQLLINLSFGTLLTFGLYLIGMRYALLWGFIAAMMRFIPYVGSAIAALLPIAMSVAIYPGWLKPIEISVLFLVLETFTANVLEPLLLSHSTGVSPMALLVAAVFWTWLWGPIGLVLATPLTTCLVVLGKFVPSMEFFDVLLGDEPVLELEVSYYQRLLARDQDEATLLVEEFLQTHPVETVYDEMLLPALVLAKRDRERGELAEDDQEFILQVTRDILEDVVLPQQQVKKIATAATPLPEAGEPASPPRALVFGCPAQDETDELALHMFQQLLELNDCRMEIGSVSMLSSEMIGWIKAQRPDLVCIASVAPGGVAHARYLCKRLRAQFADLKILLGRWGQIENVEKVRERLRLAGADQVGISLLESLAQLLPLVVVVRSPAPRATQLESQAAPGP